MRTDKVVSTGQHQYSPMMEERFCVMFCTSLQSFDRVVKWFMETSQTITITIQTITVTIQAIIVTSQSL